MKRILTMAFALLMVVGLAMGCGRKAATTDDPAPVEGFSDEAIDEEAELEMIEEAVEAPADVEAVAPVEAAPIEPAPVAPVEEEDVEEEPVEEAPAM